MAPTNTFLSSLSFLPLLRVLGKFSVLSSALFALNSQSNWFSSTGQVNFELPDGSTWNPIELSNDSSQSQAPSFQVVVPRFLSRKSPTFDSFWKSMWELLVVAHSSPPMESPSVLSPHLLSSAGSILSMGTDDCTGPSLGQKAVLSLGYWQHITAHVCLSCFR